MRKRQKIYLLISASTILTGFLLTGFYRPYIYSNQINDYGFADTIGSLASVIGFCFFVWSFTKTGNRQKNKQIIIATIIYGFIWEGLGLVGLYGTFDIKDMFAVLVSGALTYCIKEFVDRVF